MGNTSSAQKAKEIKPFLELIVRHKKSLNNPQSYPTLLNELEAIRGDIVNYIHKRCDRNAVYWEDVLKVVVDLLQKQDPQYVIVLGNLYSTLAILIDQDCAKVASAEVTPTPENAQESPSQPPAVAVGGGSGKFRNRKIYACVKVKGEYLPLEQFNKKAVAKAPAKPAKKKSSRK